METKGQKVAVGLGLAALITAVVIAATREAEAEPPPPELGKANLYGTVSNAATGQPVSGVLVELDSVQAQTDNSGRYTFSNIQPGEYTVRFSKDGYQTVTL